MSQRRRMTDQEWARVAGQIVGSRVALISEFCLRPDFKAFSPELQRRYFTAEQACDPEVLWHACRAICREAYQRLLASWTRETA